jgi:putative protein kinase ArgK-like GTPase of G3E family
MDIRIKLILQQIHPSPFTCSLLGDRLRMQEHFTNPQVFIRSIATRGAGDCRQNA